MTSIDSFSGWPDLMRARRRRPRPINVQERWTPAASAIQRHLPGFDQELAILWAELWSRAWFDADDIEAWLDAGAEVGDIRTCRILATAGISPSAAFNRIRFKHWTITVFEHVARERMTGQEARAELERRRKL